MDFGYKVQRNGVAHTQATLHAHLPPPQIIECPMCWSPGPQLCAAASPRRVCAPRQHGPGAGLLPQECSGPLGMPRRCRGKVAEVHRGGGLREPWVGRTPVQGQRASSPAPGTGQLDAVHRQEVSSPIILSTPSLLHLCVCLSVCRQEKQGVHPLNRQRDQGAQHLTHPSQKQI